MPWSSTRRAPAVVLCALATHAVVYGAIEPGDAAHGYFAWYAPVVTVLSLLALGALPLLAALTPSLRARLIAPVRGNAGELRRTAAGLAAAAVAFVLAQELVEHALETHTVALPRFGAVTWLVLVTTACAAAASVTLLARAVDAAVDRALDRRRPAPHREPVVGLAAPPTGETGRATRRPLSVHGALRAPPAPV